MSYVATCIFFFFLQNFPLWVITSSPSTFLKHLNINIGLSWWTVCTASNSTTYRHAYPTATSCWAAVSACAGTSPRLPASTVSTSARRTGACSRCESLDSSSPARRGSSRKVARWCGPLVYTTSPSSWVNQRNTQLLSEENPRSTCMVSVQLENYILFDKEDLIYRQYRTLMWIIVVYKQVSFICLALSKKIF